MHYKCQKCKKYTTINSVIKSSQVQCKNVECGVIIEKKGDNFFIYIPLAQQLQQSIKMHFDSIQRIRGRPKTDCISDIHDGENCRKIDEANPGSINLTFVMNTDGAKVFESSNSSFWPVLLYQNFLSPSVRFVPNNILVVALHFGDSKPNMSDFLLPLIKELIQLQKSGIIIESVAKDNVFKPFISNCSCDLLAKAPVQAFLQFNGGTACGYCLHPGISVINEKNKKQCRYVNRNIPETLRTHKNVLMTLQKLRQSKKGDVIDGIKGISPLIGLKCFDLVHGFSIDYMHCITIGITQTLFGLWMDSKNHQKPFYIDKENRAILNHRILSIKPPSWITRKPRAITASLKANEKRHLLLFYLRFCLSNVLSKKYVDHFQLLSAGTYLLLQKSISQEEHEKACRMLRQFADEFENYYGKHHVTMNVHLLRHIGDEVKYSGPLWAQSLFGFEAMNGVLVKTVNGTTDVLLQITKRYILKRTLAYTYMDTQPKLENESCVKMMGKIHSEPENEEKLFLSQHDMSVDEISLWKAITINREKYTSIAYKKTKSVDYFLEFTNDSRGKVKYYILSKNRAYALVDVFAVKTNIDHLSEITPIPIVVAYAGL